MSITISIIIPVYNVEKYLDRCIKSILNQTYTNFELILVNDGSKDNSGLICDEYARDDKRIKVIHQKNKGLSKTRDIGIKVSTGEYIMFLDSDDYIEINSLEILYEYINKEKYDLLIYGYYMEFIDENKKISVSPHSREYYSLKSYLEEYSYYRKNGTFGFVWNKLYKSEIIKKNNILFGEYVFPEDVYFNFKILPVCKNIKVIDNILYHYMHQRSDTLSKVSRDKLYTSNRLYDETVKFLKEMNSYDINAQFVNSVYIESLIDYIVSDVVKCNGRVNKLKLLYNEENVRYAINKSQHSLVFYKIMNKMIKFKLPTTSIIFICLYKYYDKIKKLKRG